MKKEPIIITWAHLSHIDQLKVLNYMDVLIEGQVEPELRIALTAARNELQLWSNQAEVPAAPLDLSVDDEVETDEPYVVKKKEWVH
jgi:hypothetical protein